MAWGSMFGGGTGGYVDPFLPVVRSIEDWGWSILPRLFFPSGGSGKSPSGGGSAVLPPVIQTPVPVVYGTEGGGLEFPSTVFYPVLPGPVATGGTSVPREIIRVEDVSTEVEHHPEGDFPAGSIFAPGEAWGGGDDHGLDSEDPTVAIDWGGIVEWGLDTLTGQQPWQTFSPAMPAAPTMSFAGPVPNVPTPSGIPGQPTTITGYSGGTAVTNGDTCGNRRYVTLDRETGKISCKRRRRRRLLTNRDLADLASLKTITGGGAALNAAVIRAVR